MQVFILRHLKMPQPKGNGNVFQMGERGLWETTNKAYFSPKFLEEIPASKKKNMLDLNVDNIYYRKKALDPIVPIYVAPKKVSPPIKSTHQRDFQIPGFSPCSNLTEKPAGLTVAQSNTCRIQYGSEEMANRVYNVRGYRRRISILLPYAELYKRNGIQLFRDDNPETPVNSSDDQQLIRAKVDARLTIPIAQTGKL